VRVSASSSTHAIIYDLKNGQVKFAAVLYTNRTCHLSSFRVWCLGGTFECMYRVKEFGTELAYSCRMTRMSRTLALMFRCKIVMLEEETGPLYSICCPDKTKTRSTETAGDASSISAGNMIPCSSSLTLVRPSLYFRNVDTMYFAYIHHSITIGWSAATRIYTNSISCLVNDDNDG
jgi:hypothetical protein